MAGQKNGNGVGACEGLAVPTEAHRVGPGWRKSLSPRIGDQAQCFQCLHAQDGLSNVPHEDRRRGFAALKSKKCQVPGAFPKPTA